MSDADPDAQPAASTTPGFPEPGAEMTHILVVSDLEAAHHWWVSVLGAEPYREYGGTSAVLKFGGGWLLLVTGGGPTPDKPDVTFQPPADPSAVSHAMTIRVADCRSVYATLLERGATFLTPPIVNGRETRCFTRDPDGHLVEFSQYA
jgi:catechol 2,3-dioxygenase-like lactoylglutathione lyase family enzyme